MIVEGGSPRSRETKLKAKIESGVLIPDEYIDRKKEKKLRPKPKKKVKVPSIKESLPKAFRKSRPLYKKEIDYLRDIFEDALRYDKVRITRDHWFSLGSTRVTGNTINFASFYGGEPLFEDTPKQALNQAGLDLLGHEAMHVWQYQHGGWAYAGDALTKQAAGYYSTGSRNTAYDWQTAHEWGLSWEDWGPEQQAQAIDDWNLAKRGRESLSGAAVAGGEELVEKLQPYVEKVRKGQGATQVSIPGTFISVTVLSGIGYLLKKQRGVLVGSVVAVLINLPWNKWFLGMPKLHSSNS